MGQDLNGLDLVQPNTDPQDADPGKDGQTEEPFEPFGLGDSGPLQVEASGLEAAKRAFVCD